MFKFLKQQKQQQKNLANPTKRFLAYSLDIFLVNFCRYCIFMLFYFLWFAKTIDMAKREYFSLANQGLYDLNSGKDFWQYFISHQIFYEIIFILSVMAISGALYWIIMPISKYHASLGKYLLGLKLVSTDNKALTLKKSIYRYLVGLIPWFLHIVILFAILTKNGGLLLFGMVFVVLWYDPAIFKMSRKTIHDLICKTKVSDRDKNP